jgi:hypothetical protein
MSNISGTRPAITSVNGRRAAVVIDMGHVDAGALLEHLAGEVPHAARSRRGEIERLGAFLRDLDQLRNGVGGKRFC